MGFVTIVWSLTAGFSVALAVVAGSVGFERRNLASQTIVLLGVALAAAAYLELFMMHSATPREYGEWSRWYHIPYFLAVLAQVLFIHLYLGPSRLWLMWTVIAMRLVLLFVNFTVRPNFNFSKIESLHHQNLLGEQVSTIGQAVTRSGWQWFSILSLTLLMIYLFDTAIRHWRTGRPLAQRKAITISLGIAVPWLGTMIFAQLIIFRVIDGPITILPWLLGALLIMMFEMSHDHVSGRRALAEVAELRRQLMHRDRIGALGQLSAALAHQLSQPLTANNANAQAALGELESEKPDLEEVRAILADIDSDSRRAAEVIISMRELIRSQPIRMQPVRMDDVLREVVALIEGEIIARRIALSLIVQPDLPRVMGDRVHLSQVLINLLMNSVHAVQACPPEARRIVIEARTHGHRSEIEMAVRDSGEGIPDGDINKLFQAFVTTKPDGMGIGLALSRTIIEAHGGRLWIDRTTTPQDGASFCFTLQRA
jgi:signal transduction histidine kinase